MKSLSVVAAMVETPMQEFLTAAASRCKTALAGFGIRLPPSISHWDQFDCVAPQAPCGLNQASIAAGAVATRGLQIGASSPAATGGIDAT